MSKRRSIIRDLVAPRWRYKVLVARLIWLSFWMSAMFGFAADRLITDVVDQYPPLPWLAGIAVGVVLFIITLVRDARRRRYRRGRLWLTPISEWEFPAQLDYDFGTMGFYRVSADGNKAGLREGRWPRIMLFSMVGVGVVALVALFMPSLLPSDAFDAILRWTWIASFSLIGAGFITMTMVCAEPQTLGDDIPKKEALADIMNSNVGYWVLAARLFWLVFIASLMTISWYMLLSWRLEGSAEVLIWTGLPWFGGFLVGMPLFMLTLLRDKLQRRTSWTWTIPLQWSFPSVVARDLGVLPLYRIAASNRRRGLRRKWYIPILFYGWIGMGLILYLAFSLPLLMDSTPTYISYWTGAVASTVFFLMFAVLVLWQPNPEFQRF